MIKQRFIRGTEDLMFFTSYACNNFELYGGFELKELIGRTEIIHIYYSSPYEIGKFQKRYPFTEDQLKNSK
jgi:hypothetical protein